MHHRRDIDIQAELELTRRSFLNTAASGVGGIALASLLQQDGLLAAPAAPNPLAPKSPHFPGKAKNCIFFFMAGAPSQIDLFDPKPKLNELHGQVLPESMTKNVRFAFINKNAKLLGSSRTYKKYGQCGMEFSDLLPHLGSCADDLLMVRSLHSEQFNHHPGQLMMQCGRGTFGLPSMGSWLTYGLGSESQDLPGYVVLSSGVGSSGGATLWQSGFLPSTHAGVLFREQGEPVLNLANPDGLPPELQRASLDTLRDANQQRLELMRDPEIASRIASYELAYRMQSSAPELIDFSSESKAIYASWDHHGNIDKELPYNAAVVDQPIAVLIKDLKERGMLEDTMVVWGSEFGRTPLGQGDGSKSSGRDHHPFAFTMLMAGGGIKGGQVYGESDEFGWGVEDKPVHINDLHATMLHCFGLEHEQLTYRFQGRDFRLTDVGGKVIKDWLA
jgi:hypothetical protein